MAPCSPPRTRRRHPERYGERRLESRLRNPAFIRTPMHRGWLRCAPCDAIAGAWIDLRVPGGLLQRRAASFVAGLPQSGCVRAPSGAGSVGGITGVYEIGASPLRIRASKARTTEEEVGPIGGSDVNSAACRAYPR